MIDPNCKAAWRDVIGNALHDFHCQEQHRYWQACPKFRREVLTSRELDSMAGAALSFANQLKAAS